MPRQTKLSFRLGRRCPNLSSSGKTRRELGGSQSFKGPIEHQPSEARTYRRWTLVIDASRRASDSSNVVTRIWWPSPENGFSRMISLTLASSSASVSSVFGPGLHGSVWPSKRPARAYTVDRRALELKLVQLAERGWSLV